MAEVLVQDTSLQDIADAIREKNGTETTYKPSEMGDAVRGISGGGGSGIPPEALVLTGNCNYRFANNGWNWFIEEYGDQITTENITSASYMFYNMGYNLTDKKIKFEINFGGNYSNGIDHMFDSSSLYEIPKLNNLSYSQMDNLFYYCTFIRTIPPDFVNDTWKFDSNSWWSSNLFSNCSSIRTIPENFFRILLNGITNEVSSSTYSPYAYLLQNCCVIDGIKLPTVKISYNYNCFSNCVYNCNRIKEITFFEKDESQNTFNWKNQTIDLTFYNGYATNKDNILNYNSGITADKEVKDDVTYQALKNDPDWFTQKIEYSRYNHDSAVNTINSLPDVSAGTGNTIKFKGDAGSNTDGGAINTLTPEEIAVASAKGWTVTLV